jgi:hypothetical protein
MASATSLQTMVSLWHIKGNQSIQPERKSTFRLNGRPLFAMIHATHANENRRVVLERNANAPPTAPNFFQTRNHLKPPSMSSGR